MVEREKKPVAAAKQKSKPDSKSAAKVAVKASATRGRSSVARKAGVVSPSPALSAVQPPADAVEHLRASDAKLRRFIDRVGPCLLLPTRKAKTPYEALGHAIVFQQLSGKAAGTIFSRVAALFPKGRLDPEFLLSLPDEKLRGAGLSRGKLASLRDLSEHAKAGRIPTWRQMLAKDDDEWLIEHLTQVRGIGRWTVEMMLIFQLGRPDVLPLTDLGVRKGAARLDGKSELPDAATLTARAEKWRPYRSVASWYLWRIAELPTSKQARSG